MSRSILTNTATYNTFLSAREQERRLRPRKDAEIAARIRGVKSRTARFLHEEPATGIWLGPLRAAAAALLLLSTLAQMRAEARGVPDSSTQSRSCEVLASATATRYDFNIEPQPLGSALQEFAWMCAGAQIERERECEGAPARGGRTG